MKFIETKGARIPALGLGTWRLTGSACERTVRAALEMGYRHIDTASIYGNEAEVGAALRRSGVPREEVFLTTKVWRDSLGYEPAKRSVAESLHRLGLDHVDLVLIHWPGPGIAETLHAFAELRAAGRTRWIGVSNFDANLLREAIEEQHADLLCNQVEYHPLNPQREVLEYGRRKGLMLTAYSPLAKGRLVDNPALARIGTAHGKTPAQVVLRWLIEQDGVAAIPKAGSEAHLAANLAIFDFTLSAAERATIDALGAHG